MVRGGESPPCLLLLLLTTCNLQAPRAKSQWDGVCPWLMEAKKGDSHSAFLFHLGIYHGEMMVNVFAQMGTCAEVQPRQD